MVRLPLIAVLAIVGAPAFAQSEKEVSCEYQAQVVSAVQQARLDRVKEREVPAAIAETSPTWPDNYNAAIPLIAPWVYSLPIKDVREKDLAAAWNELCLKQ